MSPRSRATWLPASTLLLSLVGGTGACFLPGAAQAYGLTGSFAKENWDLNSYEGITYDPNPAPGSPPPGIGTPVFPGFSQGFPAYQCADPVDSVNCVQILNEPAGNFVVVGSDVSGNGEEGQSWSTQWEVVYTDPVAKTFSFNWTYTGGDGPDFDESFFYYGPSGNLQSFILGSGAGDNGTVSLTLQPNWILGFGVATADNKSTAGKLVISGFDAEPVPAPLPLLGAGAAFGWSRRLRSRIRRRAAGVTRG